MIEAGVNAGLGDTDAVTVVVGRFDPVVVRGLVAVLEDDPRLCVVASGLPHAGFASALVRLAPQVAIVDEAGERAVRERWRLVQPATALLVLALDPTPVYGMALLAAGVSCLARHVSYIDLVATVRLVSQGHRIFARSDDEPVERRDPSSAELLTKREREVAVHLGDNETYSQIASVLGIGVRTVESYAARVRHKLHAQDNRKLVGMPVPRGWCSG